LKHLKYRCMEIFRGWHEYGNMNTDIFQTFGNGVDGQRRINEFTTYCIRRVEYTGIE